MTDEPKSDVPQGTPEGYTREEPSAAELGEPGTPGAGHHDPVTHMDSHTVLSDDDHGHGGTALGPIDWASWTYALLGAAGGVAVLVFFWLAIT